MNCKNWFLLVVVLIFVNCSKDEDPTPPVDPGTPVGVLNLNSDLKIDYRLENKHTCNGANVSPEISWSNSFATTESYVVVASNGQTGAARELYWLLSDISSSTNKISIGETPSGAIVGMNTSGTNEYAGPCPEAGSGMQDFIIQLFALDKKLNLTATATESEIISAMNGSILKEKSVESYYSPFTISSDNFENEGRIPTIHTCDGSHSRPTLKWVDGKTNAVSYAIHMFDATASDFIHWLACDITVAELSSGTLPEGVVNGKNDQEEASYFGPCPPANASSHSYYFRIYALDKKLNLNENFTLVEMNNAMKDHVIDQTEFYGLYPE